MSAGILDHFGKARSCHEVVSATSQFLKDHPPVPLENLGLLHVETVEDIDRCIERIQRAAASSPLIGYDEDRVERLLSYLLIASIRARQLA